jgi:rhamnogalacturonan endolyase
LGDPDGDGQLDMLIAQNIERERGDDSDQISCLTAGTLDGKILWQSGRPDPRNGLLTNDTPFQIHDEMAAMKSYSCGTLEGSTGKVRHWVWMPPSKSLRPCELENGDSLAFFNLSGNKARHEILVKDVYSGF